MEYRDLFDVGEDARIKIIVDTVMATPYKRTAFSVEMDNLLEKGNRYIKKIRALEPKIRVVKRYRNTPCDGVESIELGL